jgi:hypothetical protein
MPIASDRPKKAATDTGAGASVASNETPVSTAEKPDPAQRSDGNTPSTRENTDFHPAPMIDPQSANPADHANATGHDHPSQTEHAHRAYEKLRGESARRLDQAGRGKTGKSSPFDPRAMRQAPKTGGGMKNGKR